MPKKQQLIFFIKAQSMILQNIKKKFLEFLLPNIFYHKFKQVLKQEIRNILEQLIKNNLNRKNREEVNQQIKMDLEL